MTKNTKPLDVTGRSLPEIGRKEMRLADLPPNTKKILTVFEIGSRGTVYTCYSRDMAFFWYDYDNNIAVTYFCPPPGTTPIQAHALFTQRAQLVKPTYICLQISPYRGIYKYAATYARHHNIICMTITGLNNHFRAELNHSAGYPRHIDI